LEYLVSSSHTCSGANRWRCSTTGRRRPWLAARCRWRWLV
jgi:hypothetical protein